MLGVLITKIHGGIVIGRMLCLSLIFALGCGKKGDQQKVEFDVSDETEINSDGSLVANPKKITDERFPAPKGLTYTSGVITWQKPEKHEKVKFDYILYFFDSAEVAKPGAKPMATQTTSEESFKYELPIGLNSVVVKILAKTDRKLSHVSAPLEIKKTTAAPVVAEVPKTPKVDTPSTNPPVTNVPEPVKPEVQPDAPPVVENPKVAPPAPIEPAEDENDKLILTVNLRVAKGKKETQIMGYADSGLEIISNAKTFQATDEMKIAIFEKVANSPTTNLYNILHFQFDDEFFLESKATKIITQNKGSEYKLMIKSKKGTLPNYYAVGEIPAPHYAIIGGGIVDVKPSDTSKTLNLAWVHFTAVPDECLWSFGNKSKIILPTDKEVILTAQELSKIKEIYSEKSKGDSSYALSTDMTCTKTISKTITKDSLNVLTEVSVFVGPEFFPKIKFTEGPAVVGP